jgi:hypothetical protein
MAKTRLKSQEFPPHHDLSQGGERDAEHMRDAYKLFQNLTSWKIVIHSEAKNLAFLNT